MKKTIVSGALATLLLGSVCLPPALACTRILWNNNKLAVVVGRTMDWPEPSSQTPLPGNVSPTDRFVRSTYFQQMLPEPKNEREAISGIMAIARNVSVPFGAPYKNFGIYNT